MYADVEVPSRNDHSPARGSARDKRPRVPYCALRSRRRACQRTMTLLHLAHRESTDSPAKGERGPARARHGQE